MSETGRSRAPRSLGYFIVGAVAGAFTGLSGIGGGVIVVPLMVRLLRMRQVRAHGTSLVVIVPKAAVSLVAYQFGVDIDWRLALAIGIPAFLLAPFGARVASRLPTRLLRRLFAALVLVVAVTMLAFRDPQPLVELGLAGQLGAAAGLGVIAGLLSGLLGIGGGVLIVPVSVLLLGLTQLEAQGLSLLLIVPTALSGSVAHSRFGNVEWRTAAIVAALAIPASFGAAVLAARLDPVVLRTLFAVVLLYFALDILGVRPIEWLLRSSRKLRNAA